MKANKRMNLFAGLSEKQQTRSFNLKNVKLGVHAYFCLGVTAIFLGVGIPAYRAHKSETTELAEQVAKVESEIQEIVRQSEEQAEREKQLKIAAKKALEEGQKTREVATNVPVSTTSSPMDGSWTAVIWKLVTFADGINVDKIELGRVPVQPGTQIPEQVVDNPKEKKVTVEGSASSLSTLAGWMEVLTKNLPNSNFVVDRHGTGPDKAFPVTFRLVARVL